MFLEPQQIELIKPSIDSFLKTLNRGDLKGQFNILLNLVRGQIAKSKAKITLNMEDMTLHAFKYMLDNNLLKCEAFRIGFEQGHIYNYVSYQQYFEIKLSENYSPIELITPTKMTKASTAAPATGAQMIKIDLPVVPTKNLLSSELMEKFTDKKNQNLVLNQFGTLLLAHTNYTLIKILSAFKKTKIDQITKTMKCINNIISFSKDQLKQNKGLDMQADEKAGLRE